MQFPQLILDLCDLLLKGDHHVVGVACLHARCRQLQLDVSEVLEHAAHIQRDSLLEGFNFLMRVHSELAVLAIKLLYFVLLGLFVSVKVLAEGENFIDGFLHLLLEFLCQVKDTLASLQVFLSLLGY